MITNIKYLNTAVDMLGQGQTPMTELSMLKAMRDVCELNIERIESEFQSRFDKSIERNLIIDQLKGETNDWGVC